MAPTLTLTQTLTLTLTLQRMAEDDAVDLFEDVLLETLGMDPFEDSPPPCPLAPPV